jgi:hypothetical protein
MVARLERLQNRRLVLVTERLATVAITSCVEQPRPTAHGEQKQTKADQ